MAVHTSFPSGSAEPALPHAKTKLRAEQMHSEDGFNSLAADLFAIRSQISDIIGGAEGYKTNVGGYDVQLAELNPHLSGSLAGDLLKVKQKLEVTGDAALKAALDVDGEATLASAIIEDVTATHVMFAGVGGAVQGDAKVVFDGTDLIAASAKVSDLTDGRVVLAGASGSLGDSANLTFDGSQLKVTGNAWITSDLKVDGNFDVNGTVTYIDTTNLLVADAKVVISSGSLVDGAGIYLADETNALMPRIAWSTGDTNWVVSGKLATPAIKVTSGLTDSIVWADADGDLVEITDQQLADAIEARLVAGTGVSIAEAGAAITFSIGQPVGTGDQVAFAGVTAYLTGSGLTNGSLLKNNNGLVVDADINDFISGGTGVTVDASGVISIGQAVATTDTVTFGKVFVDGSGANDAYIDGGSQYLELGYNGGSITVAQSGSVALSGLFPGSVTSIIGALNDLKSTAAASSKKATYGVGGGGFAAGNDLSTVWSTVEGGALTMAELSLSNCLVFLNGQLMTQGASADYELDKASSPQKLVFKFALQPGDAVVVQKA